MSKKVIIIGSGIGGIAAATLLAKAGYSVTVLEKNPQFGGRMGALKKDGFVFDTGPSWYLMPEVFQQYFDLVGVDPAEYFELKRLSPAYKVYFESSNPITIESDIDIAAATFEAIEPGAGKKLKKYVDDAQNIYDLAVKYFLYTNFTHVHQFATVEVLKNLPLFIKTARTDMHSYIEKNFKDQRLQQILEYPMVFLGSSPFKIPAMFSLMAALDYNQGVYYPIGGMNKVRDCFVSTAKKHGVVMLAESAVQKILVENKKATGVKLQDGTVHNADIIVSNADMHHTEQHLLDEQHRTYSRKDFDALEPGPSALLMYLGVSGSIPEIEHHTLLFVDEWKKNFDDIFIDKIAPSPASIYLSKTSATDNYTSPATMENIFVLVPFPPGVDIDSQQIQKLADNYLLQIEQMTGVADLRRRIVSRTIYGPEYFKDYLNSWQNSALGPSHILRQSGPFRSSNKSKKLNNLYYVGGTTSPGIGVPMCLISAELLFKRIHGINHHRPLGLSELII